MWNSRRHRIESARSCQSAGVPCGIALNLPESRSHFAFADAKSSAPTLDLAPSRQTQPLTQGGVSFAARGLSAVWLRRSGRARRRGDRVVPITAPARSPCANHLGQAWISIESSGLGG